MALRFYCPSYIRGIFIDQIKWNDICRICRREGYAVAQLLETLYYKPEGEGIDSRRCHWNFSMTILPAAPWLWS
jgi:hypothetical protein